VKATPVLPPPTSCGNINADREPNLNLTSLRRSLVAWFDRHQRVLPWRANRDPYRIWISEVMLQQTTVAAVIPYFQRFMTSFPTVQHLARADEQEVLHLWQGLGYYRRARHIHQAAQIIVNEWGGEFADDAQNWIKLPGVGRYILGAVLSQAYDRRMPIIEANSLRVLSRVFAKCGDPKSSEMQKWLWATAERVLPRKRVGDFNQALMELGALVCTPVNPKCKQCPIRNQCAGLANGDPNKYPSPTKSMTITEIQEVAVVVRNGNRVLIAKRPPNAKRWSNMWEFPQAEVNGDSTHEQAGRKWLKKSLGMTVQCGTEITSVRYGVTRFRLNLTVIEAKVVSKIVNPIEYPTAVWVESSVLKTYPMSTAQRRVAVIVAAATRQRRLF
jgi:A/G-specific adenine glycosylase